MFSNKRTSPAFRLCAADRTSPPSKAPGKETGLPSNSLKRFATGAKESSDLTSPLGRPRWAAITTLAPAEIKYSIVGSDALIRPSSVMTPFFNGTLRSQRRKTRFPTSSLSCNCIRVFYQQAQRDPLGDWNNPIRCHTNQQSLPGFQLP